MWPFKRKKKEAQVTEIRHLQLNMTVTTFEDIEWYAAKRKMSVQDFIMQAVLGAMPANVGTLRLAMISEAEIHARVEEIARQQDEIADAGLVGFPPKPIEAPSEEPSVRSSLPPAIVQAQVERKTKGLRQVTHTCYNFVPSDRPSQSNGVCNSELQRGRPCDWPAGVAHDCTYFVARRVGNSPGA